MREVEGPYPINQAAIAAAAVLETLGGAALPVKRPKVTSENVHLFPDSRILSGRALCGLASDIAVCPLDWTNLFEPQLVYANDTIRQLREDQPRVVYGAQIERSHHNAEDTEREFYQSRYYIVASQCRSFGGEGEDNGERGYQYGITRQWERINAWSIGKGLPEDRQDKGVIWCPHTYADLDKAKIAAERYEAFGEWWTETQADMAIEIRKLDSYALPNVERTNDVELAVRRKELGSEQSPSQ